ncbi:Dityrosine transporter 1 [Pleurostoma richardsiae]|uniref:Dityrosine transporter 1 n=1 Tax=Pleurostoma richardsiae TaxID=41990 RepID=A0AA38VPE9_9PEZI|nr:Dityrosine transporter 1 [Pleurostoma richardsiae]
MNEKVQDDDIPCRDVGPSGRAGDDIESARGGDSSSDTTEERGSIHSRNGSGSDTDDEDDTRSRLSHISTHVSLGPDNPVEHYSSFIEVPDEVYDRIPSHRKLIIVCLLSFCSFLAPISSTTVLSAVPEVAKTYDTTGTIINISNALYMLFMGISPIVWGPLSEVWGRRPVSLTTAVLFCACSIGTALAPNLAAFFIFRILTAFEGTSFLLVGSACLGDIYRPTERGSAMGWFLSGTLVGPAFGPFLGGIIVTYTSWRVIFWMQTGLAGLAVAGAFFLLPETIHHKKIDDLEGYTRWSKAKVLWSLINPMRVLRLYRYPNLLLIGIASSSLVWNMYSLLTPIRYVLNPRFHLTSPMQSGLFYLAPGCGYLVGTFFGGRYADHVVKRQMRRRGQRIPEDRMRSALPFMGIAIPACVLVYGWGVDQDVGGIPLAVITLFLQGVAQLFCFPSLNTYCLDVMQSRGSDVIAGNYFVRYLFACAGTAVVLPAVEGVGVGWFSTISAAFLAASAAGTWATIRWGKGWRDAIDKKRRAQRVEKRRRVREELEARDAEARGREEEKRAAAASRVADADADAATEEAGRRKEEA